jgi:predicted transposase/invertase (TIGR01784 family)
MKVKQLIRFDWAMKRLLRHKANFDILEGFLSELLKENVTIKQILDGESNKNYDDDKHNRVDILVENAKEELVIIEIQNSKEYDYFHRMLYGTSKVITEHIKEGEAYALVRKVISITIAYFDLGQGKDYVYHGTNVFKGLHKGDILTLSDKQIMLYNKNEVYQIYPEYWVIKVGKFANRINDKLDEWIYFLKNSEVKDTFSAKGLKEAGLKLDEMKLSEKERKEYNAYLKRLRDIASEQHTKMADAQDLINEAMNKGREQHQVESILGFYDIGITAKNIAQALKLDIDKVLEIIEKHKKKIKSD